MIHLYVSPVVSYILFLVDFGLRSSFQNSYETKMLYDFKILRLSFTNGALPEILLLIKIKRHTFYAPRFLYLLKECSKKNYIVSKILS